MNDTNKDSKELDKFIEEATALKTVLLSIEAQYKSQRNKIIKEGLIEFLLGTAISLAAGFLVNIVFQSGTPIIPPEYLYLVVTATIPTIGISAAFLITRSVYKRRQRERVKTLEDVRLKEKVLFDMLRRDFDLILRREDIYG